MSTAGIPTLQLMCVFTLGQFTFFLLLWTVVGTDLVSLSYGYEVIFALLAGINVQVAEYLFTIACKYLKSSIATACVSVEVVFSSFVLYAILPAGISITYLSLGLVLISLGIFSNLMPLLLNGYRNAQAKAAALVDRPLVSVAHNLKQADYDEDAEGNQYQSLGYRKRSMSSGSARSSFSSIVSGREMERKGSVGGMGAVLIGVKGLVYGSEESESEGTRLLRNDRRLCFSDAEKEDENEGADGTDVDLAQEDLALQADAESLQPSHNVFWISLALFAGLLMSSWAILTSLSTIGEGGITHTGDLLFIFSCGQVIALPILIVLFGYYDVVNMRQPAEEPFRLGAFVSEMAKMPPYRHLVIFALALLKDVYEAGYFYVLGSGEIPRAVIYATLSTVTPIATLGSLFIFREYDDVPLCSDFYLFTLISFLFFALGVFVVLNYAFDDSAVSDDYEFF